MKTILVVEDYTDTREFMKFMLESFGYSVIEAINGLKAVEAFQQGHPDLIFMDVSMPEMDGLTATKAIRQMETDWHIPIIALTAFGKQFCERAASAGCDELLDKPIDFDALESILNRYLIC